VGIVVSVAIKRLDHAKDLPLPAYQTKDSAGMDLCAAIASDVVIEPSAHTLVPTGYSIALPSGFEAQVRPRSGLAAKNAVTVLNSPGTIDADYRGEVGVLLINHGTSAFTVTRGMRIAQLIVAPVRTVMWEEKADLADTARGAGGFGSTGTHRAP
jgi:dUTP pyrophosphatase